MCVRVLVGAGKYIEQERESIEVTTPDRSEIDTRNERSVAWFEFSRRVELCTCLGYLLTPTTPVILKLWFCSKRF
jgi:hypothetical protein